MGVRPTEPTKEKAVKNRTMVFRQSFMSIRIIYLMSGTQGVVTQSPKPGAHGTSV